MFHARESLLPHSVKWRCSFPLVPHLLMSCFPPFFLILSHTPPCVFALLSLSCCPRLAIEEAFDLYAHYNPSLLTAHWTHDHSSQIFFSCSPNTPTYPPAHTHTRTPTQRSTLLVRHRVSYTRPVHLPLSQRATVSPAQSLSGVSRGDGGRDSAQPTQGWCSFMFNAHTPHHTPFPHKECTPFAHLLLVLSFLDTRFTLLPPFWRGNKKKPNKTREQTARIHRWTEP